MISGFWRDGCVKDRELETTAEHPFWVEARGWVECHQLRVGDKLRLGSGWATVESLNDTGEWKTLYNFRVAEYHTYFVGSEAWGFSIWTHNAKCAPGAGDAPLRTGPLFQNPSQVVTTRVGELRAAIPTAQQGWITMGVAVVEDANGVRSVLISTSEPRGYLRPGVTLRPGETMVVGTGHAEADIIAHAQANNLRVIDIGATRPVCVPCQDVINPTGANISTPLRPRPGGN